MLDNIHLEFQFNDFFWIFSGKHKKGEDERLMNTSIRFEEFLNEVLVKILSFLKIVDFIKCSKMCRKISTFCYDNSLWKRINL